MDPPTGDLALRLFEEHAGVIRSYFRRLAREPAAADDLAQEVFLHVVRSAGGYQPQERERAWLFRIARNVLIDHRRRSGRSAETNADVEGVQPPSQAMALDLQQALNELPEPDREAFVLAEVGGLTYTEIARLTGSTVPSVRSRIYRARLELRRVLPAPAPLRRDTSPIRDDHDR